MTAADLERFKLVLEQPIIMEETDATRRLIRCDLCQNNHLERWVCCYLLLNVDLCIPCHNWLRKAGTDPDVVARSERTRAFYTHMTLIAVQNPGFNSALGFDEPNLSDDFVPPVDTMPLEQVEGVVQSLIEDEGLRTTFASGVAMAIEYANGTDRVAFHEQLEDD